MAMYPSGATSENPATSPLTVATKLFLLLMARCQLAGSVCPDLTQASICSDL